MELRRSLTRCLLILEEIILVGHKPAVYFGFSINTSILAIVRIDVLYTMFTHRGRVRDIHILN